jgi:signal peptidase I
VARLRLVDETQVSKRIVGLPGETVTVKDKQLVINGSIMPAPKSLSFLCYYGWGKVHRGKQVACDDKYFYLGDDSRDSMDSRFDGPIDADRIIARAWLIVWPPDRIGFVNP